MSIAQSTTRTAFVVFRYVPKVEDAVDVVKMFFERLSRQSGPTWQVEILGSSLPSGNILLEGVSKAIKRADLVVVVAGEISHNVAFELGLAYALEKPFILLAPKEIVGQIPRVFSDIAGMKCAVYDPDRIMKIPEVLEVEYATLRKQIETVSVEALSPDYLIALGDILQLEGLYEEARGKYEAACDLRPRNTQYLVRLAQAHAAVYNLTNAEYALRKAVALDPQCAMAFDALGQVLLDGGQYETAIKDCFLPLINLFPRVESYYFKVAIAYTELGAPERAAEFLGKAIANDTGSAALYYDLAWTSVRASRKYDGEAHQEWIEKGINALCKAVDLDPSFRRRAADDQDFDDVRGSPLFPVGK